MTVTRDRDYSCTYGDFEPPDDSCKLCNDETKVKQKKMTSRSEWSYSCSGNHYGLSDYKCRFCKTKKTKAREKKMTSPGDRSHEAQVASSAKLAEMYDTFEEMGVSHRYDSGTGELEVCIFGVWFLFYVNKRALEEENQQDEAFEDAQRVAEGHWKE
jgi:hypothetical protein